MPLYCSSLVTWETSVNITLKLLPALTKIYECPETMMLLNKNGNVLSLPFLWQGRIKYGFSSNPFCFKDGT